MIRLRFKELKLDLREVFGLLGGLLTTSAFVPQVWRLYRLKSAREISLSFTVMFVLGVVFWLAYGISFGLLSIVLWNTITFFLGCSMLYAKIKFG